MAPRTQGKRYEKSRFALPSWNRCITGDGEQRIERSIFCAGCSVTMAPRVRAIAAAVAASVETWSKPHECPEYLAVPRRKKALITIDGEPVVR